MTEVVVTLHIKSDNQDIQQLIESNATNIPVQGQQVVLLGVVGGKPIGEVTLASVRPAAPDIPAQGYGTKAGLTHGEYKGDSTIPGISLP